jgi:hypothetical protein
MLVIGDYTNCLFVVTPAGQLPELETKNPPERRVHI